MPTTDLNPDTAEDGDVTRTETGGTDPPLPSEV